MCYIIECDLVSPAELHYAHKDYRPAPERHDIQLEILSETHLQNSGHYARTGFEKNFNLVRNLIP